MKTIVTFEGDVCEQLANLAQATGRDFNKLANELVRSALKQNPHSKKNCAKPFQQRTAHLGWYPGMTWKKIINILEEEDDASSRQILKTKR